MVLLFHMYKLSIFGEPFNEVREEKQERVIGLQEKELAWKKSTQQGVRREMPLHIPYECPSRPSISLRLAS